MSMDSNLEKEADRLEREAKIKNSQGEYTSAIELFQKAKNLNQKLGYRGKVNMIEKKIQQTNNLIKYQKSSQPEYTPTFQKLEEEQIKSDSSISKPKHTSYGDKEAPIDPEKEKEQKLTKKAEKALDKGNQCIKDKNFKSAKKFYKESIELFKKLGWTRQVQIIEKELDNIDNYAKKHQNTSPKGKKRNVGSVPISRSHHKSFYNQTPSTNTNIIDIEKDDDTLTPEERRRIEIRGRTERKIREAEKSQKSSQKIAQRQKEIKRKKKKEREGIKKIQEKKQKEDRLLKEAEKFLDRAKNNVDNNKFDEAKEFYRQAIKIFKELGWFSQVDNLYNEIKNLEKYKIDYLRKQKQKEERKKKQKVDFQRRVEKVKKEKREAEKRRLERIETLSEENKKRLEKAKLLLKKAEKEEKRGKLKRAIGRYEIIIDLYRSLPQEKIDLSNDISEIKTRLSDLRSKI